MKKAVVAIMAFFLFQLAAVDGWATERLLEGTGASAPKDQKTLTITLQERFEFEKEPSFKDLAVFYASIDQKCVKQCVIIAHEDEYPRMLFQALLENPLESCTLDFRRCDPCTNFKNVLETNLLKLTSLQSLALQGIDCSSEVLEGILKLPQLKELRLETSEFWSETQQANFFNTLSHHSTLTTLKLDNCGINSNDAFDMLENNTTLTELVITGGDGSESSLQTTHFDAARRALKINTTLRKLDLTSNYFTGSIVPWLTATLLINTTLEELSLGGCWYGDGENCETGIKTLLKLLQYEPKIKCKVLV
jgi:hypothetical protein